MAVPTPWRRRTDAGPSKPANRVGSMADSSGNVLHLCRFPEKCCPTCDRHRERCAHPIGGSTW